MVVVNTYRRLEVGIDAELTRKPRTEEQSATSILGSSIIIIVCGIPFC
jgi:hypothetical protein